MRRRNCEDCKHYKITRKRGMDFHYCSVWDCQFESREDDDDDLPKGQGEYRESDKLSRIQAIIEATEEVLQRYADKVGRGK